MSTLADMMENLRNYSGKLEWQRGKDIERMAGGDPEKAAVLEQIMSLGEGGGHAIGGLAGMAAKNTFIKNYEHAQQIADKIHDLAYASGLDASYEAGGGFGGSHYLTLRRPDASENQLRIRISDHQNKYGGNDIYIDPSETGTSIESGMAQIKNMFPEFKTRMPSGTSNKFIQEKKQIANPLELKILKKVGKVSSEKEQELWNSLYALEKARDRSSLNNAVNQLSILLEQE